MTALSHRRVAVGHCTLGGVQPATECSSHLNIDEYATIIGIAGRSFALVNQNVYSKATPDLELSCMVLEISAKTLK